jgi:hypothetical protein
MAIRLNGLAAPEGDEPGGAVATQAMVELVQGRTLRCELDGQRPHDRSPASATWTARTAPRSLFAGGSPAIARGSRTLARADLSSPDADRRHGLVPR